MLLQCNLFLNMVADLQGKSPLKMLKKYLLSLKMNYFCTVYPLGEMLAVAVNYLINVVAVFSLIFCRGLGAKVNN